MIQAAIDFAPVVRVPSKGTQLHTLLLALQRGEILTVSVALREYGVYALSQRMGDLRRSGWPVESAMVEVKPGTRVAQYKMAYK